MHAALEAALPAGSLATRRFDRSAFAAFQDFELLSKDARALVALDHDEVQALGRHRAVSGHFALATLLEITDSSSIATVLREPRARLLSLYTYWRIPGISDFWAPSQTNRHARRPLAEFLAEPVLAPAIDNQICRMLLYGDTRLPDRDFARASDLGSIAGDAIEQLEGLGFVGVMELDDTMWHGLGRLFGVSLSPISLNVTERSGELAPTPGGGSVTAAAIELLGQRSAADLLVYDHVLARAGLSEDERRRLKEAVFAQQLVKFGDLLGSSALRAAKLQVVLGESEDRVLRHERTIQGHERTIEAHEQIGRRHALSIHQHESAISRQEQAIQGLRSEVLGREEELDRLHRWLGAMHTSASWRLTGPLRAAKHALQRLR